MQVAKCLLLDTPPFLPVWGTDDSEIIGDCDVCVDHGSSDVGMAQECLCGNATPGTSAARSCPYCTRRYVSRLRMISFNVSGNMDTRSLSPFPERTVTVPFSKSKSFIRMVRHSVNRNPQPYINFEAISVSPFRYSKMRWISSEERTTGSFLGFDEDTTSERVVIGTSRINLYNIKSALKAIFCVDFETCRSTARKVKNCLKSFSVTLSGFFFPRKARKRLNQLIYDFSVCHAKFRKRIHS